MSTVETTSYYDSLTTATTETTTTTSSTDNTTLDSDDFITLLLAELEYQDPTDPVDNAQMVDQMTQYSQLEQLTEMNETLEALSDSLTTTGVSSGLDYLGKEVTADGYTISLEGDDMSNLYYEVDEDSTITSNIYDSDGNLVETVTEENVEAGTYQFSWDGTDSSGNTLDDGLYYVIMSAENSDGDSNYIDTYTTGTVTGVSSTTDGVMLTLDDGRSVNMLNVTYATS